MRCAAVANARLLAVLASASRLLPRFVWWATGDARVCASRRVRAPPDRAPLTLTPTPTPGGGVGYQSSADGGARCFSSLARFGGRWLCNAAGKDAQSAWWRN